LSSTPSISEFHPLEWQWNVIRDMKRKFDFTSGYHDLLLSGTVGSAKSMLGTHLGALHLLEWPGAVLCLGRRSMPDLKDTIFAKLVEHLSGNLEEGRDFWVNETRAQIEIKNGSKSLARSWGDKKAKKARSLDLSALLIEELTENDEKDKLAIDELKMRVGRVPHVKENWVISMTNPDSPSHWAYKYYFTSGIDRRHVYLSKLDDNPHLPPWYKPQLLKDLDPKMARRMVGGEWLEIAGEVIYYAYDRAINFRDTTYKVSPDHPIRIAFDFNIGEGKPLSVCAYQKIEEERHFFDEVIVYSSRTEQAMEEMAERGLFDHLNKFYIHGDATGRARHTAAKHSNYEVIKQFLENYVTKDGRRINFEVQVPVSNPPIRTRHAKLNGSFKNALGQTRTWVYRNCKTLDEGFRLTKLKSGANYVEDDSKYYQHVTTAAGYGVCSDTIFSNRKPQGTEEL
jgi:PBSX family phage terminase large subunit